jgi:hypothetical protein
MAISPGRHELDALAAAGLALASAATLPEALQIVADGAARAVQAEVTIARAGVEGRATVLGVASASEALAAELAGSGFPLEELTDHEESKLERMPPASGR